MEHKSNVTKVRINVRNILPNKDIAVAFIGLIGLIYGVEGCSAFWIAKPLPSRNDSTRVTVSRLLSNKNVIFSIISLIII